MTRIDPATGHAAHANAAASAPRPARDAWLQAAPAALTDDDWLALAPRSRPSGLAAIQSAMVIGVDAHGHVTQFNPTASKLLGLSGEEALGQPLAVLPARWRFEQLAGPLADACWATTPTRLTPVPFARPGHDDGLLDLTVNPVLHLGRPTGGALLLGADITGAEHATRRRELTARMAALGELAAGVAHEIRTPLQTVAANARFLERAMARTLEALQAAEDALDWAGEAASLPDDMRRRLLEARRDLARDELSTDVEGAVRETLHEVGRIGEIVQAVRHVTHPGDGPSEPVDVVAMLEDARTVTRHEWHRASQLVWDVPTALPAVTGRRGALSQAVINLLTNAAQALDLRRPRQDPARILVRAWSTPGPKAHVVVQIADDGPGVPEELAPRIFAPFFTTKAPGEGTGQGLALARSVVVDGHGGSLTLAPTPPGLGGACFEMRLPCQPT